MPSSLRLACGPGGCWCWPRCWTVTASPAPCSPPRPPASTWPARTPRARRIRSRPGRRCWPWSGPGLVAVDAASAPPTVWISPALQTAVRAVAAAGAAGPGGPRGGRCAGAGVAPAPAQVMAGRRAAVVRGEPAAGRRGRAVGRRLSSAAAGHGAEPGGRRTGRPGAGLVAGAGRGQRAAPRPGPPGHPGGRWPAGCRAAGRRAGRPRR